tara:strand:+ start:1669 stop:2373 length:705 start_codon:yes stop_codon:yes gene_type:complete
MSIYYKIKKIFDFPIPIFLKKNLKKYFGKNNLDQQIEEYLNFDNGFYIELGAHDGISQSNTFYYEKKKNWKGILIEPTKHIFNKCKKHRSKKNFFYNCACVSFAYEKKNLELTYSGLKTFSEHLISDNQKIYQLSNPEIHFGEKNFSYIAEARTLNSLLDESNAPNIIDFMSLDTEGSEFEVLNGIDFKNYNFKYMLIETNHFSKLDEYLSNKKYKFLKKFNYNDFLFKYDSII